MTPTSSMPPKKRGRPKVFDREEALEKAMHLFWQYGYEGTSLSHLVTATGAKAPTLYAEFTNKEGLFRAVLEYYIARFTAQYDLCLCGKSGSFSEILETFLRAIANGFTAAGKPAGCFIVSTSSGLSASAQHIADTLKARQTLLDKSLALFLQQRQQQGEIPEHCNTTTLADYLGCIIRGMAVAAQQGASYHELLSLVKTTIQLLPELIKTQ